jgi:tRNA threonylcarbamoyladenosine biosynthesis protein TsaE
MTEMRRALPAEADTLALGRALAACIEPGLTIYLIGELGAGKTTLARGLLRGLGYSGKVKSPTFTLVEVYEFSRLYLYHFDFYRFRGSQELGEAGFREYFNPQSVCLVEWPEKTNQAAGLPAADLRVILAVAGSGRNVSIFADSEAGVSCLTRLQAQDLPDFP